MPDGHCADPSLPLHLDQGRGSSKKESFSLRVSPALHPPERPSPRRADMAGHGHGSGNAGTIQSFSTFAGHFYFLHPIIDLDSPAIFDPEPKPNKYSVTELHPGRPSSAFASVLVYLHAINGSKRKI